MQRVKPLFLHVSMAETTQKKNIVIIGGGVIGAATAYYLTRHPKFNPAHHTITLLEATAIAAGASGKAGGLLGLWAYPQCLVPLSYRLHRELAEQHGGYERWGYRTLECGSIGAVVTAADLEARKAKIVSAFQANETEDAGAGPREQESMRILEPRLEPGGNSSDSNGYTNGSGTRLSEEVVPSSSKNPPSEMISAPALGADPAHTHGQVASPPNASSYTTAIFQIADPDIDSPEPDSNNNNTETASTRPKPESDANEWEKLPKQDPNAPSSLPSDSSPLPANLNWIDDHLVQSYTSMGRPPYHETAQVHPYHFTTSLASLAASAGVQIRLGAKVTAITPTADVLNFVEYEDRNDSNRTKRIDGVTDVIVTAGPWTGTLLPRSKIEGLRAHSVVYEAEVSPFAVFTDIQLPGDWVPAHRKARGQRRRHRGNVDPEVYARPFGEVYACGEPDKTVPLPETADKVATDEAQCDDLAAYLATISPTLASAPIKAKQVCYIPQHVRFGTERGPLIGPTSMPRVWIAAGHTCWGIQNAPATGVLMAEWVFDGQATAAEAGNLHPAKFKV